MSFFIRSAVALMVVLLASASCSRENSDAPPEKTNVPVQVSSITDISDREIPGDARSRLVFTSGDSLVLPLIHVRVHRVIRGPRPAHWVVVSGIGCSECDAAERLDFIRIDAGATTEPSSGYAYPGEQFEAGFEPETPPVFRSRAFVGACLPARRAGAVMIEESRDTAGTWTKAVRIVTLTNVKTDSVLTWSSDLEQQAVSAVSAGECQEIPGTKQYIF